MNSRMNSRAADRCGMCGKSRQKLTLMGHILLPLRAAGDTITEAVLNILAGLGVMIDARLRKYVSAKIHESGTPSVCSVCVRAWAEELSKDARLARPQTSMDDRNQGSRTRIKDAVPSNHPDYCDSPLTPAEERTFREVLRGLGNSKDKGAK